MLAKRYIPAYAIEVISKASLETLCLSHQSQITRFYRITQPKIIDAGDTIIKFFYPKRKKYSTDKLKPYAIRFCHNIKRLREKGFNAPDIFKIQYCASENIYIVHYKKITGQDIRYLAQQGRLDIVDKVSGLMRDLHQKGIIFGSIHLENLLYQEDQQLALIDTGDVRFKRIPLLMPYWRYRNLKRLFQEPYDKTIWETFGVERFVNRYCSPTSLYAKFLKYRLAKILHKVIPPVD